MRFGHGFVSYLPVHHVDAAHQSGLSLAGLGQTQIRE